MNLRLVKIDEMENTVLMPHAGSATYTTRKSMVELACKKYNNFFCYTVKII